MQYSKDDVWAFLSEVQDPEVPVVNIVELGIVREVSVQGDAVEIAITPTYSGCPAMDIIEADIKTHLSAKGLQKIEVKKVISPPWTSDWLTDAAKEKLKAYGIAPPGKVTEDTLVTIGSRQTKIPCPFCNAENTELRSEFGATACKSLYYCKNCMQPFEHFKAT